MDSQYIVTRSLPPLVEGKIHGYLKCTIDEVVWSRRNPRNISIIACWWGELDNAVFRPVDAKSGVIKNNKDMEEIYAIKTNLELFKEYLRNSETVELTAVTDKSHQVIGRAHITDLLEIFTSKSYFQYFPIYNEQCCKIGDVRVTLKLTRAQRNTENPLKSDPITKKQMNLKRLLKELPTSHTSVFHSDKKLNIKDPLCDSMPMRDNNIEPNENIYQSVLRDKRLNFNNATSKLNSDVADELVAQVVARAQKLRGEMLNDANDNDPLIFNENSTLNSIGSDGSIEHEAALYEYFMGVQMSRRNEKKALETLRSHSPTPSLMDFAAETIQSCNNKNNPLPSVECNNSKNNTTEDISNDPPVISNRISIQRKQACPMDYVDSLRIVVDSLTLNSAGYRRVKSSCLSRGDGIPISVTYFVQYDAVFGNTKKYNKKIINGSKPVKMCSKKQSGHIIYFNHDAVYDLPKTYLNMDMPLKFKIYNRHLNQRTPIELGIGGIYVKDAAETPYLSSTQRLAIVKKDIKVGELKVTVELGCDKIHFGRQFVEAVTSAKENIPVLELSPNSNNISSRYKSGTSGDESKSNSRTTSAPCKRDNPSSSTYTNSADRNINEERQRNDERLNKIDSFTCSQDKTLLHALIYIGEGKDLPASNTYLICRAFWREDRAFSRICTATNNPFYHFHQLIPLIHDQELLNRTKDNCIITEVYSKNPTSNDNLLGIAKLSVHQLYVAYRDPLVLPHLLKSKYPVTSVDGWVSITDPVTGALCGEISALVALGTADQIALLEMTRGLRDSSVQLQTSRANTGVPINSHENLSTGRIEAFHTENFLSNGRTEQTINPRNDHICHLNSVESPNMKTQECQTEISTVNDLKSHQMDDVHSQHHEPSTFHETVDRMAQSSNIPKTIMDQGAQTELEFPTRDSQENTKKLCNIEPLCLDTSNTNSFSGDSYNNSPRENFNMSREIFRSVGVGAEFNEPINQTSNTNCHKVQINNPNEIRTFFSGQSGELTKNFDDRAKRDSLESNRIVQSLVNDQEEIEIDINLGEEAAFRAIVEIECALHLPKIEKPGESIEPSTYVTFQIGRDNSTDCTAAYMMTNICPYTCNPKYDWRCDTKLSIDLLVKEEKRLIMKVWRVIEPDVKLEIDLEKDVVIGFSAIDLSVLTAGFPIVSGWFHINDFAGKCNGQLKVSVTPLDNIAAFGRFNLTASQSRLPPISHSNNSSPYPEDMKKINEKQNDVNTNTDNQQEINNDREKISNEAAIDIGLGLGDASLSFLSLSLERKFSELDEIKKRLQSRLQDVTSTAFDDDFENDFDLVEHDYDHDKNRNNGGGETLGTVQWLQQPINHNATSNNSTNGNNCYNNEQRRLSHADSSNNAMTVDTFTTDTGYSTISNPSSEQILANGIHYSTNPRDNQTIALKSRKEIANGDNTDVRLNRDINGHVDNCDLHNSRTNVCNYQLNESKNPRHCKNTGINRLVINDRNSDFDVTMADNHYVNTNIPIQGTKVHIDHLLNKLSTKLTVAPPEIANLPMQQTIEKLISSLRRNNNNFSNDIKCNREANVRTIPTQTDINYFNNSLSQNNFTDHINNVSLTNGDLTKDDGEIPAKSQKRDKISTVIRDELIADDHNDSIDYDCLSTRLIKSNVRHMASSTALNPLMYPHILPDISVSSNGAQNEGHQNVTSPSLSPEGETIEQLDSRYVETFNAKINKGLSRLRDIVDMESSSGRISRRVPSTLDNDEIFRVTPTGISENVDGNIDVTVIHKPCNDDLMASNNIESTAGISIDNDMRTMIEIDDNSSLNSSDTLVTVVSRQAPDGGNPAEDPGKLFTTKRKNHSKNSSSSDS